jgi:cytochrome c oxidase subunit 2
VSIERSQRRPSRPFLAGIAVALLCFGAASCGDNGSDLSEAAQAGRDISRANGCASCHGSDGQGGVGPSWVDLAGSEVKLKVPEDEGGGTRSVIADDEYLLRAILEPGAEEVEGYTLKMPTNGLTEAEARSIVTYIKELTSDDE